MNSGAARTKVFSLNFAASSSPLALWRQVRVGVGVGLAGRARLLCDETRNPLQEHALTVLCSIPSPKHLESIAGSLQVRVCSTDD
jgi:hypothetical protein